MDDQSNLMGGRKPSHLTADFSIRILSATCVGSVPVVWTKRRSYRRYNGVTTAVRTPVQRRYNAGTTPVQRRPDRASSILKPYFVRTYVLYVGPHTGSCCSDDKMIDCAAADAAAVQYMSDFSREWIPRLVRGADDNRRRTLGVAPPGHWQRLCDGADADDVTEALWQELPPLFAYASDEAMGFILWRLWRQG